MLRCKCSRAIVVASVVAVVIVVNVAHTSEVAWDAIVACVANVSSATIVACIAVSTLVGVVACRFTLLSVPLLSSWW